MPKSTLPSRDDNYFDSNQFPIRPFDECEITDLCNQLSFSEKFSLVPRLCDRNQAPGIDELAEWQVWVDRPTTKDQRRIEEALEGMLLSSSKILHIGIGNSSLAKRFGGYVSRTVGTTLHEEEKKLADSLTIPNYNVLVCNKYSPEMDNIDGIYDFIIDNNPMSFSCCLHHFSRMMLSYSRLLNPESGQFLTALPGYGWVVPKNDPHWSMSWNEWEHLGKTLGLSVSRISNEVYSMGHLNQATP